MPRIIIPSDDLLDQALRTPSDTGTPPDDPMAGPGAATPSARPGGISVGNKRPHTSDSDSDAEDHAGRPGQGRPAPAPPAALPLAPPNPALPVAQPRQLVQGLISLKKLSDNSAQELYRYGRVSVSLLIAPYAENSPQRLPQASASSWALH